MDVKRYGMGFGTRFETGTGGIGDCPAFGRECVEVDVTGFSCRALLGEKL